MTTTGLFARVPLFADLDPRDLADLSRMFRLIRYQPGTPLISQGQHAGSAFVVESGSVDVRTSLPGGGEAHVAVLGPGAVIGEMALLEHGTRTATVVAREPTTVHFIERDGFRMLLAQQNDAAFVIQGRIARALCRRLRDLNARVMEHDMSLRDEPALATPGVDAAALPPSFDWRRFLPALPAFRAFDAEDLDAFAGAVDAFELERGTVLFREGGPADACYVVARGAVEIGAQSRGRNLRLGIIGPGRLCGHMALLDGVGHSTTAVARERATLLRIDAARFDELIRGRSRVAAKFQDAISENLMQALARTNNDLTRLISQSSIRAGGGRAGEDTLALLRAFSAQDCSAPR